MRTFLLIAWRNIWRNRRRTIITTSAIVFSVAITILSFTLNDGSHDDMLRQAIRVFTGYIQVQPEGYQDDPTIEKSFVLDPEILETINTTPGVTGYSPRLQVPALVATSENSTGGMVVGVMPELEKNTTVIPNRIASGTFLGQAQDGVPGCVIGDDMAKNLLLEIGDDVALVTQGIDGSLGALKFKVQGIFNSGSNEIDRSLVFIRLENAQDLVRAYDMVNSIAVMVNSQRDTYTIVNTLQNQIQSSGDRQLVVLGWRELMPDLVQMLTLDSIGGYIFLAPLLIIVIFGILSTLISSVLERTHEFGIMLALGTRPAQIVQLVMFESILLTGLGLFVGVLLGLGFSYYYSVNPIHLPQQWESITAEYGMENLLRAAIYMDKILLAVAGVLFFSMLFSLYPAWKASSLKPDRAIRDILT